MSARSESDYANELFSQPPQGRPALHRSQRLTDMSKRFKQPKQSLKAAQLRAGATKGEASPRTVNNGPGPCDTPQSSGKSPGRVRPQDGSGVVQNIVLFEGPEQGVRQAVAEIQREYPSATVESAAETARHRELFRRETHALPAAPPADAITIAVRFQSEPPEDSESVPDALLRVYPVIERWREILTIGQLYFDPRRVPSAAAMIRCVGPNAESASPGVADSRSAQMPLYSRIQQHFCGDFNAFFRARLEEIAEVDATNLYHQEWDEKSSPLGLEFSSEDPARQGWGLSDGLDSAPPDADFLVPNGYLPPEGVTVAVPTSWIDALTLVLHAEDAGVCASFDGEGRMLISGYALRAAGLIDANLKPTIGLSTADRRRYRLGDPPSKQAAMIAFLRLYAQNLDHLIPQYVRQNGADELASRLRRHRAGAQCWLLEHAGWRRQNRARRRRVPGA